MSAPNAAVLFSLLAVAAASAVAFADVATAPPPAAAPADSSPQPHVLGEGHGPLTISQAVDIAISHNPGSQMTHEKLNELDADVRQTYAKIFPNISITGSALEKKDAVTNPYALFDGDAYNMYTIGAAVTQPIWASGLLSGGIDLANSNRKVGELNDDITQRTLALNVIEAFYSIIQNQRNLSSLENERKVDEDLVKTITKYYHVGRNQLLDVLQEQTTVAQIVPQIAQAKNQIQIAATQLATYLGDRNADQIEVIGTLDMPDRHAIEDDMRREKLRIFENELVDEQLRQVDYNRTIGLAPDLPSVNAVATWGRNAYVKTDLFNDDATTWSFGIQLTIPVFSGLSTVYERHMYASQEKQATINKIGTYDQSALGQVQTMHNLDIAEDTVKTSALAYKLAQDSMKEATRTMRLGTISLLQYQTSQQALLSSEVLLDQSKYTFISDLSQYVIAMGYPYQELVKRLENKPEETKQ